MERTFEKYPAGFSWASKMGRRSVVGPAWGRPSGWLEISTEGEACKHYIHEEDIQSEIDYDMKQLEHHKRREIEHALAAVKEEARRKEWEDDNGFTDGMSALQKGKILKVLNKKVMADGEATTIKALIRRLVAEGRFIGEHAGKRTLENAEGCFRDEKQLTKIGMDFAEYLICLVSGDSKTS